MTARDYVYTLSSYLRIFADPAFYRMLWITFIFVLLSVVFQFLLGLVIALAVDRGERIRARGTIFTRTVALISWAIPGVAIGIIWKILYNESPSGVFNYFLSFAGLGPVPFLTNPTVALLAISLANVWRGTAQSMILLYAGLKTVPVETLEAAQVDGARSWQRLIRITLPSIRSVIVVNILLNIINTFNTFDMIMSLTGGGPGRSTEVLVLNSYTTIFQLLDLGKGSATAVLLLVINILMSAFYIRIAKQESSV
jgi:multiple sugar transport system permease protein